MTTKNQYIQESAYYIWLNRGKPEGQDVEIWNEAVKIYELTHSVMEPIAKAASVAKKSSVKKVSAKKAESKTAKKASTKKVVAKKTETKPAPKAAAKPAVKKVAKKSSAKVTEKPVAKKIVEPAKKVEVAKIIPMVKPTKKASAPKAKIKIVVGAKK